MNQYTSAQNQYETMKLNIN